MKLLLETANNLLAELDSLSQEDKIHLTTYGFLPLKRDRLRVWLVNLINAINKKDVPHSSHSQYRLGREVASKTHRIATE